VITFVEEKEGLAFADAVESLADRFGVEVEREQEDPRMEEARKRENRLRELLERTAKFYVSYLWESKEARKALAYLRDRGFQDDVLKTFEVGFAPNRWDTVVLSGQKAGYSTEELIRSGLVKRGQKGGLLDHFRARIMFPIRDARGRIQGFGGRATRDEQRAKYVNSPEGKLFNKSETVYGIHLAKGAITKLRRVVIMEGYTDVLAAHQAGVNEAVAVMGTAITPKQIEKLSSYSDDLILALDADRPGREAMLRGERVAASKGKRLRVAPIPPDTDPADMLAGKSASPQASKEFVRLIDGAVELPTFHMRMLLHDADLASPQGRDEALREVAGVLSVLGEGITRNELVREASERLNIEPGLIVRRIGELGARSMPSPSPVKGQDDGSTVSEERPVLSAQEVQERALLAMCIAAPAYGRDYVERLTADHLSSPAMARVRDWLVVHLEHPRDGLPRDDEELADAVTQLVVRAQREPASPQAMELNFLLLEKGAVERQIAAAQANGGDAPVELQKRRADLTERIAHHQESAPKPRN
jgi:DNA primase